MIQLTISSQGSCWGWEEEFLVTQHTAGCVKSPFLLMLLATSCGTEGHSHKFLHQLLNTVLGCLITYYRR